MNLGEKNIFNILLLNLKFFNNFLFKFSKNKVNIKT